MKINMRQLPAMLKREVGARSKAVINAQRRAATRAVPLLAALTPVDLGEMKDGWYAQNTTRGAIVGNDAPHAAFIEFGTRPHPVSVEGQAKIRAWVLRKISSANEGNADSITFAICKKIRERGSKPHWIIKKNMPKIMRILRDELKKGK
jgi:hypothetical protein